MFIKLLVVFTQCTFSPDLKRIENDWNLLLERSDEGKNNLDGARRVKDSRECETGGILKFHMQGTRNILLSKVR